jgi:hypothetical protein
MASCSTGALTIFEDAPASDAVTDAEPAVVTEPSADAEPVADGRSDVAVVDACGVAIGNAFACDLVYTDGTGHTAVKTASCTTGLEICQTLYGRNSYGSQEYVSCLNLSSSVDMAKLVGLGFDATCLASCPSCACGGARLPPDTWGAIPSCEDLPDGGMVVRQVHIAVSGCYGCPPARVLTT